MGKHEYASTRCPIKIKLPSLLEKSTYILSNYGKVWRSSNRQNRGIDIHCDWYYCNNTLNLDVNIINHWKISWGPKNQSLIVLFTFNILHVIDNWISNCHIFWYHIHSNLFKYTCSNSRCIKDIIRHIYHNQIMFYLQWICIQFIQI